jgi:hypothetical protein
MHRRALVVANAGENRHDTAFRSLMTCGMSMIAIAR